jgi:putative ABC transport system permease protein
MWRNRTGPLLVAAQVALTLAVVVNVAYFIQWRLSVMNRPTGIDMANVFSVVVAPQEKEYNYAAAVQADLAWLNLLPGVIGATISDRPPQTPSGWGDGFATTRESTNSPQAIGSRFFYATERYLDALGVKLAAGRNFEANEVAAPAPDENAAWGAWPGSVLVTQTLADELYPKGDALGKPIWPGLANRPSTIVGIVEHMEPGPYAGRSERFARRVVLVPMIPPGPDANYIVRTEPGKRDAVMARVEQEVAARQPGNRYVSRIQTLEKTAALTRANMRSSVLILSVVSVLVLAVTMVGTAGLAAFNVTTRTKQLGTRRALGAQKFHILRYFLVENWLITTVGALVGCTLALAAGIKVSEIYHVPRLPLYYLVAGVAGLWALGVVAVFIPARRAASVSPAIATRTV